MSRPTRKDPERRQLLSTARQYRNEGYRVTTPTRDDELPAFLGGYVPDLIAERADDRVVVAIKRADRVAGSNDLVDLADRVGPEAGWRFEFISVSPPIEVEAPSRTSTDDHAVTKLLDLGSARAAFLVSFTEMENMIYYAAVQSKLALASSDVVGLARELVGLGVLADDIYESVLRGANLRNRLSHAFERTMPTREDVLAIRAAAKSMRDHIFEGQAVA